MVETVSNPSIDVYRRMEAERTDLDDCCNNEAPSCQLQDLPHDVHCLISSHLQYRDVLRMSVTNKFFHQNLNPRTLLPRSVQNRFIGEVDLGLYVGKTKKWACFGCQQFLPKEAFGDRMRKSKQDKRGAKMSRLGLRRCWTCAIEGRLYEHLQPVRKDGEFFCLCHKCGRMQTESMRCRLQHEVYPLMTTGKPDVTKSTEEIDQSARVPGGVIESTVCTDASNSSCPPIQRLPAGVLELVVQNIDMIDAIHLLQTNRHMNDTIKTKWVPLHKRFQFVRRREPGVDWFRIDADFDPSSIPRFACYACFTVKPRHKFPDKQHMLWKTNPSTFWKMRCDACVDFLYNTEQGKEALREFNLHEVCDRCSCLKERGKPCYNCIEKLCIDDHS
ncbi:hypothetical protein CCHR01_09518 [Colletotrichum chrysophilum]|uniref:F-box domain-containing protein n=1 Tax=Colletotrichum chrysophilum TaxID=1836956 RepID=A0AAD9EKB5_9PEZI|nr:hypothetical protein CCHR01_09518 [Colletotrichum chrysophilum]